MANLILPSRRVVAPQQGVALNRAKVKETGTLFAAFAGTEFRDVVSGLRLANPGGSRAAERGRVATFNGAQSTNLPFTMPSGYTGLVVAARIRATGAQPGDPGAAFGIYASTVDQCGFGVGFNSASNQVGTAALTNNGSFLPSYSPASIGQWFTVYAEVTAAGNGFAACYVDGRPAQVQANYNGGFPGPPDEIVIGGQHRASGFLRWFNGEIEWAAVLQVPGAVALTTTGLTPELAARLYASNYPYNLLAPIDRRILVAVPTGATSHSLDAAAQAAAAATAALSVQASAQLAGSAQAQAAASATMLKGVTLAAASIAQAGASASLAHGVPLAASAAAVAASSAGLALGVTLAASAIATAAASAGLTVTQQNALSANASAQASGSAVLSLQVLLSASAVAQAAAAASAAVGKRLAANAVGEAGGSAALLVGAPTDLSAGAQSQASAGAQLAVEIPLTAQALAQAIASGSLTVAVRLQANALATSSATAVFSEEVRLSAGAKALASAQAVLQIGPMFARAPAGSGYRRPQPIGDRPPTGQSYRMRTTNTTRPGR